MLQIVFATTTTTVSNGPGRHIVIHEGEHWWAGDPIVKAHAGLFTTDPSHGLCSSVQLPDEGEQEEIAQADAEWAATVQHLKDAGITAADAIVAVEAAQTANAERAKADETTAEEEKTSDASQPQAPVEQATKAPGEKSAARKTSTRRG